MKGAGAIPDEVDPLNVLGINAFGHDAAAVLLVDGEAVFASSEERYDRVRHSAAWPRSAIDAALCFAGLAPGDVDAVAFPWTRGMARGRKVWHLLRHLPDSRAYLRQAPSPDLPSRIDYLRRMRGLETTLRREGFRGRVVRVPHHEAHAWSAALCLDPTVAGAVVTADGMGEWTTTATWAVDDGTPSRIDAVGYPDSAGKAYAAVTQWLGFRPESGEGKTMGLAPYGDPTAPEAAFARGLLRAASPRALLRIDRGAFGFVRGESRLWGPAFERRVGPARSEDAPIEARHRNVARGIQDAVEDVFLDLSRDLVHATGARALAVAGGLFLNCALNGHLRRALDVPVLPFPVAGDAGAAWGAAAATWRRLSGRRAAPLSTVRLGHGIEARNADSLVSEVAGLVAGGALVGIARQRAEFGPRALGNRSLLATPTTLASRDRVNAHKGREAWRPLAPVVREGDATYFEDASASPWMILTFRATAEGRASIPGGIHVDGTARVQTVTQRDDPFLHALLERLPQLGHPACVLNTSLNRRGEPIVNTAEEARRAARAMRLDALVLGDRLLDSRALSTSS